ncbi:hypothetical protein PILCRDRAFT_97874 [Piloderma croceum F 1598]|uniref:Blue (type 1) copper domain-containing protein n=1 Tax=Piloderma croceum (strain F 1598) TaxID=765440 RepID=A0A0C3BU70_PILCF|nr:hypothetical protein PILCRDRAFT_97874 [Piloderma croceum F 1598]
MIFTTSLALIALPALVAAQYGPPPAPASGSSSTSAATSVPSAPADTPGVVNINVAANEQYVFSPANVSASNNTAVNFFFPMYISHHVQISWKETYCSSIDAPCTPLDGGFDSSLEQGVQMTLNITDQNKPVYFFCKQILHCGMGMVGGINLPPSGAGSFEDFQAAAEKIGGSETTVPDNGPQTGGVGAELTASPAATITAVPGSGSSGSSPSSGAGRVVANGAWVLVAAALAMAMA